MRKKRCAAAHYVAALLSSQGCHVFSPLTHNEILQEHLQLPKEHWLEFDLTILALCQRLLILKLDGWENSSGVQIEIAFAKKKKIPIEEMMPPEESLILPFIRS